ncbi:MAG: hypothetical protein R3354_02040 [Thiohalomonadales bacterium]|nr:hypothetical protein [Thiohalomonadales bacterium]
MKLELEPIEGEKVLTEEEKERLKRRTRPIPPDALSRFTEAEKQAIKNFLIKLIVLTEHVDHDRQHEDQFQDYDQHMLALNQTRQALFQNPAPALANFINLLELCPSEAWKEFEALIAFLREEDLRHYHETLQKSGINAAADNPFLMQEQDNIEAEHIALEMKGRITPKEVQELINH